MIQGLVAPDFLLSDPGQNRLIVKSSRRADGPVFGPLQCPDVDGKTLEASLKLAHGPVGAIQLMFLKFCKDGGG